MAARAPPCAPRFDHGCLILGTFDPGREQEPGGSRKLPAVISNQAGGAELLLLMRITPSEASPPLHSNRHAGWKHREHQKLLKLPAAGDAGAHEGLNLAPTWPPPGPHPPAAADSSLPHHETSDSRAAAVAGGSVLLTSDRVAVRSEVRGQDQVFGFLSNTLACFKRELELIRAQRAGFLQLQTRIWGKSWMSRSSRC